MSDPLGLSIGTTNLVAARVGDQPVTRRAVLTLPTDGAPEIGVPSGRPGQVLSGFVERVGDPRLVAVRLDATDEAAVRDALAAHRATALLNATDPRFVMPLFRAALAGGATYLDMAMSLSAPLRYLSP